MDERTGTGLEELGAEEMTGLAGGGTAPDYASGIYYLVGRIELAVYRFFMTAPVSSYAYGKVGYTS